ncbi:MAG: RsmB/NOP family class I SAM-dependent RNA methyltransferase, partial [Pseudomonadota bacterium]
GAHGRGWYEVQDESSQLAAQLAAAEPRAQVIDICAGAGGKTLAFGAAMQNTGQLYAYDRDKAQLRPIFDRVRRAGVRNLQVVDAGDRKALTALGPRFDLVFVDAPCSGSGTWRRRPDAKWRLSERQLSARIAEQRNALADATALVKPGGRLVYATCSVLPEENTEQVAWFREAHADFDLQPFGERWAETIGGAAPQSADGRDDTLLLSPGQHGTDGFFMAFFTGRG